MSREEQDALVPFRTLLDGPSPAVLTTYRKDGSAVGSPVWFGSNGNLVEVVVAENDVKMRHLARHPLCALLIFEAQLPLRGIRVEGEPTVTHGDVVPTLSAIATKYLGAEKAGPYSERFTERAGPGVVLSWSLTDSRRWNLSAVVP